MDGCDKMMVTLLHALEKRASGMKKLLVMVKVGRGKGVFYQIKPFHHRVFSISITPVKSISKCPSSPSS